MLTVSIAEGKKNFTRIIRASEEKGERIVISRRGHPVAVILPYDDFQKARKEEALLKIKEAGAIYRQSGVSARTVHEISKKELEGK